MKKKLVILLSAIIAFGLIKYFGLDQYLTFDYIKENQREFQNYYAQNTALTIGIYFIIYVISTALSIPGATVLTLLGGALFGLWEGLLIVSFASTIGASLSFLIARGVLQETVQSKYAQRLKKINEGVEKEGAFYLFSLRLIPIFPFFIINLAMGLTKISLTKFFFVSQIGMLPGTFVYVNAGLQLSQLESLKGILSVELIGSFVLLGVFPLLAKKAISYFKALKVYKNHKKPKSYDYNMVVIGAGSAGLVTSYISAAVKAKVALIEKDKMGGDCLNTGCVPSKALISSAKAAHAAREASKFGINTQSVEIDFPKVMQRIQDVITKIEPHDSIERYTSLGVECVTGEAEIISPWEVKVGERILTTKNITIATGGSPFIPNIEGLTEIDFLTSNNLWKLRELPKRLVVLGGGPIGLEMAQSFQRLGSKVTVVEMGEVLLSKEDEDVSKFAREKLTSEGVSVLTRHKAVKVLQGKLTCQYDGSEVDIEFDQILVAVGRKANTKGFGLENLDIKLRDNGTIEANEFLQTNYPNIFVCGDVTGPYQLTHTASHQAWYCAVNGLFGKFKKFKVDYSVIPWCTFLDPEIATVGKNERQCQAEEIEYEVTKHGIDDLDRAIAEGSAQGFVKVITKKGSDTILGATIVGKNAGELLIEFISAMKFKKGLNDILGTIHSYPTMGEANKFAAGNWKRAHAPENLLKYVAKFHEIMR